MLLKPWYDVLNVRKELCEGVSQDWLEFTVNIEKIRHGQALDEYRDPAQFFRATYLSHSLTRLAGNVMRRLLGDREHSAIFSISAPNGGGKSHALLLLHHLVKFGSEAVKWAGVPGLFAQAGVATLPAARLAAFVGTAFDSSKRRGGKRGEPVRKTPWGELAFQLGGNDAFALVAEDDGLMRAPAKETLQRLLPSGQPRLILIDDLLTYLRRETSPGMDQEVYRFFSDLSQLAQQEEKTALVVALPANTPALDRQDVQELQRYTDLFRYMGQTIVVPVAQDAPEILRRRLFDWDAEEIAPEGKVILPDDALETCRLYGKWVKKHLVQFPGWFPAAHADRVFRDCYPFHPELLSVFTRKWSSLASFEYLRGMLRLMSLLLIAAHREGYSKVYSDPLITSGAAPLERFDFRDAACHQLGWDQRLEVPIFNDICGMGAFATRLDAAARDDIKHNRLHQKTATAIFFESIGGVADTLSVQATEAEIRLAIGEPDIPIKAIDKVLDALADHCYYLTRDEHVYRFNLSPNLNKLFADRNPDIEDDRIEEQVKSVIQQVFANPSLVVLFPETPEQLPDRPAMTLAVLSPDYRREDPETLRLLTQLTQNNAEGERRFKNAIIWVVCDNDAQLYEEARALLTWQDMYHEFQTAPEHFDEMPEYEPTRILRQIADHISRAEHLLHDLVWQTYHHAALLNKNYEMEFVDVGHLEPGGLNTLPVMMLNQLRLFDYVADSVSSRFLKHNWPPEYQDTLLSTRAMRDMFFMSPNFPRLTNPDVLKDMIAKGATTGALAYVGMKVDGKYAPFFYQKPLAAADVEMSDDRFILPPDKAEAYLSNMKRVLASLTIDAPKVSLMAGEKMTFTVRAIDEDGEEITRNVRWGATGGTIDEHGVFTAGEKDGSDFEVRATLGDKTAWVKVSILSKKAESPEEQLNQQIPAVVELADVEELPEAEDVSETEELPEAEPLPTRLTWAGTVSAEQLAELRERLLEPFGAEFAVTLHLKVEMARDDGLDEPQIEAVTSAFRAFGLAGEIAAS